MIIEVACELDGDGVRAGGQIIEQHVAVAEDLVLDLRHVSRMDSSGLGLLVMAHKRKCEQGRAFVLQNVSGQPMALLKRFHLLDVLGYRKASFVQEATSRPVPA